jgi:hypothetical protein
MLLYELQGAYSKAPCSISIEPMYERPITSRCWLFCMAWELSDPPAEYGRGRTCDKGDTHMVVRYDVVDHLPGPHPVTLVRFVQSGSERQARTIELMPPARSAPSATGSAPGSGAGTVAGFGEPPRVVQAWAPRLTPTATRRLRAGTENLDVDERGVGMFVVPAGDRTTWRHFPLSGRRREIWRVMRWHRGRAVPADAVDTASIDWVTDEVLITVAAGLRTILTRDKAHTQRRCPPAR